MRLFVADTMALVLIGIGVGLPVALGTARQFGAICTVWRHPIPPR
jgi:hypothetical protein